MVLRNRGGGDRQDIGGSNSKSSGGSSHATQNNQTVIESSPTPRLAIKGFRQKLGKAIAPSKDSSTSSSQKSHHHQSSSSSSPKSWKETGGVAYDSQPGHHQFPNGSGGGSSAKTSYSSSGSHKTKSSSSRAMTKAASQNSDSPSSSSGNLAENSTPAATGPSFLRQPKSSGSAAKDTKNRVSGSGIPTRNSLIGGGTATSGNHARDGPDLLSGTTSGNNSANNNIMNTNATNNNHNNNINNFVQQGDSASTTSLNSTSSSSTTNGMLQSLGNGTGIPKPTAAVKGTTKQNSQKQQHSGDINSPANSKQSNSHNKSASGDGSVSKLDIEIYNQDNNEINNKPEVTSCSSSDSRSNLSLSSEKSLCGGSGNTATGSTSLNKTSTSSSLKSNDTSQSSTASSGGGNGANGGITVALVSPMPSLTNSVSNTPSVSSIESTSGLTQSQFSQSSISQSNSNSNSSEVTVMLTSKYQQQSSTDDILGNSFASSMEQPDNIATSGNATNTKVDIDSPPGGNKISPGSEFASGSSSMGSLKCAVETGSSSSGTSLTSPIGVIPEEISSSEGGSNANNVNQKMIIEKDNGQESGSSCSDTKSTEGTNDNSFSQDNGNSVIPECEEDDLFLNVQPMEPILRNSPYGYIKSPPGSAGVTNPHAFFQTRGGGLQMRRTGNKT